LLQQIILIFPLEIIRKGRFDEIFFLDLPKKEEREEIFKIHLQEFRPNSWESFDYSKLANLLNLFQVQKFDKVLLKECIMLFMKNENLQLMIFVWH
jgi:SpoVK/Ycf46/Vps4 family AAA+-type ATPase